MGLFFLKRLFFFHHWVFFLLHHLFFILFRTAIFFLDCLIFILQRILFLLHHFLFIFFLFRQDSLALKWLFFISFHPAVIAAINFFFMGRRQTLNAGDFLF